MKNKWLIYGTGKTGSMIAEEAVRRGHSPLLAGRSAERVKPAAERLGLEWSAVDLSDATGLSRLLEQVDVIVNTAGPFVSTSLPMARASLARKKHYLDVSNEIPVFQSLHELHVEACQREVAVIPGVGFGVAATDGLVQHVASQIENPTEVEIATHLYTRNSSAGADITRLEVISRGGWARRNGVLIQVPLGSGGKRLEFPFGARTILPIPSGDLVTAYHSTGVPNITVYGTFTISPAVARLAFPIAQKLMANAGIRRVLERRINGRTGAEKVETPAEAHSYVWVRAKNVHGDIFEAWQEMGEGYDFTAESTVHAVEEVLTKPLMGTLTPAQAFGPDFALKVNGVRR